MYVLCFIVWYCFSFGITYEAGALPNNISVFRAAEGLYLALVIRYKYTSLFNVVKSEYSLHVLKHAACPWAVFKLKYYCFSDS